MLVSFCLLNIILLVGCTRVDNYSFVDYGSNTTTNEIVWSKAGDNLAWVSQEASGEKSLNKIWSSNKKGEAKQELLSMELSKEKSLRVMGFYPELNVLVYAIEYKNPDFGVATQREVFYKFFDEENSRSIGKNYLNFFESEMGVMGLRVGDVLAYYQLSMNNAYAIDARSNYIQDKSISALFTDAKITPDEEKVVYTFEYDPTTQGYNQNKILVSDFSGSNRKELLASAKPVEILAISNDKVTVKVGDEEQELTF